MIYLWYSTHCERKNRMKGTILINELFFPISTKRSFIFTIPQTNVSLAFSYWCKAFCPLFDDTYNHKINVLSVSLNKTFPSFLLPIVSHSHTWKVILTEMSWFTINSCRINSSRWAHWGVPHLSHCSTTGIKAMVCTILSVEWYI